MLSHPSGHRSVFRLDLHRLWLLISLFSISASPQLCLADYSCGSLDGPEGCCSTTCESDSSLFGCLDSLTSGLFSSDCGASPANSGITFNADLTQFYMGVVSGGVNQVDRYSGHGDYLANIDGGKLFGAQGMFIKIRAEHRFNDPVGADTGSLLLSNTSANLPVADSDHLYLTNVVFTQFLSETFAVFAGKMDTLDGDQNAFASGRGIRQFSNMAFVANPIALRTAPYSTLGAGFVILQDKQPIFTFTALNPTDTARTSGLSELYNDGIVLIPEVRLPTQFFGLPGHQLLGATWSTRTYTSLLQDPRIILPNVPITRRTGSWSVYYNFDQYLKVDRNNPQRGWGIFGRAGIADPETNPISWFVSGGVGGNSTICGREDDTFGAGFFYSGTSDELGPVLTAALGGVGDTYGTELFYNIAVTKNFRLTADAQFLHPAINSVSSSTVLGFRGVLSF